MLSTQVQRALEVLVADYRRQGKPLSIEQVERTCLKRQLGAKEVLLLYRELDRLGIELDSEEMEELAASIRTADSGDPSQATIAQLIKDISSVRLLTPPQVTRLARRIALARQTRSELEKGDLKSCDEVETILKRGDQARALLATANIRFVIWVAKLYAKQSRLELIDLIQEGCVGLMKAVDKFDHAKGFKFSTYAIWWIRQSITRAIDDTGRLVRLPVHAVQTIRRIKRTSRRLTRLNDGRPPSVFDLAESLELDPEQVQFYQEVSELYPESLDSSVDGDGNTLLGELLPSGQPSPEVLALRAARRDAIEEVLAEFSDRERDIIMLRYGLTGETPWTLEQVGEKYGVTRERIRQIQVKVIERLQRKRELQEFYE